MVLLLLSMAVVAPVIVVCSLLLLAIVSFSSSALLSILIVCLSVSFSLSYAPKVVIRVGKAVFMDILSRWGSIFLA